MRYKIEIKELTKDQGGGYYVSYPSLPGLAGGGPTPSEAVKVLEEQLEEHLEYLREHGIPIPPSDIEEDYYKGKIALRVSPSLHLYLNNEAKRLDISINSLINQMIVDYRAKNYHNDALLELSDRINTLIKQSEKNSTINEDSPSYE